MVIGGAHGEVVEGIPSQAPFRACGLVIYGVHCSQGMAGLWQQAHMI